MTTYGYEITPRPVELGGGWHLRLFEDGVEAGGGVFPLAAYPSAATDKERERAAYEDALDEARVWMASRPADEPADEEPAFLDDEGPSDDLPTRITLPKSKS